MRLRWQVGSLVKKLSCWWSNFHLHVNCQFPDVWLWLVVGKIELPWHDVSRGWPLRAACPVVEKSSVKRPRSWCKFTKPLITQSYKQVHDSMAVTSKDCKSAYWVIQQSKVGQEIALTAGSKQPSTKIQSCSIMKPSKNLHTLDQSVSSMIAAICWSGRTIIRAPDCRSMPLASKRYLDLFFCGLNRKSSHNPPAQKRPFLEVNAREAY